MKPKQIANLEPLKIYAHAAGLHKSYDMLIQSEAPQPGARADERLISIVAHPAIVLSVFASDLYLKTLLCIETGLVPNTRDLKSLFGGLAVATSPSDEGRLIGLIRVLCNSPYGQQ